MTDNYKAAKCDKCGMLGRAGTIHKSPPLRHSGQSIKFLPCLGKFTLPIEGMGRAH